MKQKLAFMLLSLFILSTQTFRVLAQEETSFIENLKDQPLLQQVFNEVHYEICTCIAYYTIGIVALENSNVDPERVEHFKKVRLLLWDRALVMHRTDTTMSRVELETTTLANEMHNDMTNFSILLNKYAYLCKEISEDPEKRVDYWTAKKLDG